MSQTGVHGRRMLCRPRALGAATVRSVPGPLHTSPSAPSLADVLADPAVLEGLTEHALLAMRRQVHTLFADLEHAVTVRLLAGPHGADFSDLGVLTIGGLAKLWGMKDAKIRELCRTGRIPARKLGTKEWVVPIEALREWAQQTIADRTGPRHNAVDHVGLQVVVSPVRPHRVELRRPARHTAAQRDV